LSAFLQEFKEIMKPKTIIDNLKPDFIMIYKI